MLFEKINRKINTKLALNPDWADNFFSRRIKKYFPGARDLLNIEPEIVRNFRGKFRNMSMKYKLYISFKNRKEAKIVRAKLNSQHLNPKRHCQALCFLKKNGFSGLVPRVLDYIPSLNMCLYEELLGKSFQDILANHENLSPLIENACAIAGFLYRLHHLPIKNKPSFRRAGNDFELSCRRHWAFLVRKCAPQFSFKMREILDNLWKEKKKREIQYKGALALVHGDFHWGNIVLKKRKKIGILDFGDSRLDDPLVDVASFVVQTESMFRYYCPNQNKLKESIIRKFLGHYFKNGISKKEEVRLFYLQANKYLQMAAIHAFMEPNPEFKVQGLEALLGEAEVKLNHLRILPL